MPPLCVIFDLDGTLVDSERLCNQAFLDLLPQLDDTVESLVARNRGRKLALILADIENRLSAPLHSDFEVRYRTRVSELFDLQLEPNPGVRAILGSISFPFCVASSGPTAKIRQALRVSGLLSFFGDNIFSSYEIGSWKPDPGLFLHAAKIMGFAPARCVVVEDSEVGVQAAIAAGMRSLQYTPHSSETDHGTFSDMATLPHLLNDLARAVSAS